MTRIELTVGNYETGLNVQLWKEYTDRYRVIMVSPQGEYGNCLYGFQQERPHATLQIPPAAHRQKVEINLLTGQIGRTEAARQRDSQPFFRQYAEGSTGIIGQLDSGVTENMTRIELTVGNCPPDAPSLPLPTQITLLPISDTLSRNRSSREVPLCAP